MSDFSFCNKENFYQARLQTNTGSCEPALAKETPSAAKKQPSVAKPTSFVQKLKNKFRFLTNSTNQSGSQSSSNNSSRDETSDDSEKTNSIDFRCKPIGHHQPSMMHRSITDTITSSSYMNVSNNHPNQSSTLNTSIGNMSLSTLKDVETSIPNGSYISRRLSSVVNDDVAHIFNRNSLNDCLNPPTTRRSVAPAPHRQEFAGVGGSYRLFGGFPGSNASNLQNQPKRPSCLQLNNQFKKETSI